MGKEGPPPKYFISSTMRSHLLYESSVKNKNLILKYILYFSQKPGEHI